MKDNEIKALLKLPAAGLMSDLPVDQLSETIDRTERAVQELCGPNTSLLYASLFSLACLPGIIVTDYGLVDGERQEIVEGFRNLNESR